MTKIRILIFLTTIIVVGLAGTFATFYARGYRFNLKTFRFAPNGILVIKSEPDGASVYINGDLKTATNATIPLPPGTYDVEIKKEGFFSWYKRLTIEKEIVTQATASLFRTAPSLSPITISGAENPKVSPDSNRIAYIDKDGLWVIDVYNTPLGFNRDPKKITDGDLKGADFEFSPDSNEILLNTSKGIFRLQTNTFTPQSQRVNIASQKQEILTEWENKRKVIIEAILKNLPEKISEIFSRKVSTLTPSPDGQMLLYTAADEARLAENLVPALPGASTQKQERDIKPGKTYVYDIKEDRNFLIGENINPLWLPTSRHLLLAENEKVVIMDYDGTNRQEVYRGAYLAPFAYPFSNSNRIIILTNFGSSSNTPNLYSVIIK